MGIVCLFMNVLEFSLRLIALLVSFCNLLWILCISVCFFDCAFQRTFQPSEMESIVADREQRIAKLQDKMIDLQKTLMTNENSCSTTTAPSSTTSERLGSLFISEPEVASTVTLPPLFPSENAASSPSSSSRRPSRIPSSTRRRSGESRSRCKSRVDRPLSSNAAQEKTVDEMKAEIQARIFSFSVLSVKGM